MRKIINGKSYNTETAAKVAEWSNNLACSDFNACDETLYKTPKGQFFLHGDGGAMTEWSQPCGNMRTGGEGIKLLSPSEALEWCEQRGVDADIIADTFDVEEG